MQAWEEGGCCAEWDVQGLKEAFLGAILGQEVPANLTAQCAVGGAAASTPPGSLLATQNPGLRSVLLHQNPHFDKILW